MFIVKYEIFKCLIILFVKKSVIDFLDLPCEDYSKIIDLILRSDDIDEEINKIIENRITTELEFIQMFHLSRRLYDSNLIENDNLKNLLLEKDERLVYSCLSLRPKNVGELLKKTGISVPEMMDILARLLQKGFITETVKNYYIRKI